MIAQILTGLGLLGAALAMYTKLVSLITSMHSTLKQIEPIAKHVPNLFYRVNAIERHLDLAPPEVPGFVNGSKQ